jgi:hypothetical protein
MTVGQFVWPRGRRGNYRRVHDAKGVETADAQERVDDCVVVGAEPARADRVVQRLGQRAHVLQDRVVALGVRAGRQLVGDERRERRRGCDPAPQANAVDEDVGVRRIGEVRRIDEWRGLGLGRAKRHLTLAARLQGHGADRDAVLGRPAQTLVDEEDRREQQLEIGAPRDARRLGRGGERMCEWARLAQRHAGEEGGRARVRACDVVPAPPRRLPGVLVHGVAAEHHLRVDRRRAAERVPEGNVDLAPVEPSLRHGAVGPVDRDP